VQVRALEAAYSTRERPMKRPRHEIESKVEGWTRDAPEGDPANSLLPQIRRPLERICNKLDIRYEDLAQMLIVYGQVNIIVYDRNEAGELYRDEFGRVATKSIRIPVNTYTFLGDERDI
jgi:hypothetical protein